MRFDKDFFFFPRHLSIRTVAWSGAGGGGVVCSDPFADRLGEFENLPTKQLYMSKGSLFYIEILKFFFKGLSQPSGLTVALALLFVSVS